jgi:hypothetical protein
MSRLSTISNTFLALSSTSSAFPLQLTSNRTMPTPPGIWPGSAPCSNRVSSSRLTLVSYLSLGLWHQLARQVEIEAIQTGQEISGLPQSDYLDSKGPSAQPGPGGFFCNPSRFRISGQNGLQAVIKPFVYLIAARFLHTPLYICLPRRSPSRVIGENRHSQRSGFPDSARPRISRRAFFLPCGSVKARMRTTGDLISSGVLIMYPRATMLKPASGTKVRNPLPVDVHASP